MAVPLIFIIVILVVIATGLNEGLWGNLLTFLNTVLAAILAVNFWEPDASWLTTQVPAGRYAWDFAALWGLFALFMMIMRSVTDLISRNKVRFPKPVDQAGGVIFSALTGWVLVCFLAMTLHTAPLARNFLWGSFVPEKTMFFVGPDRLWLGFMQKMSRTTLVPLNSDDPERTAFDPEASYMLRYATQREEYSAKASFSGQD